MKQIKDRVLLIIVSFLVVFYFTSCINNRNTVTDKKIIPVEDKINNEIINNNETDDSEASENDEDNELEVNPEVYPLSIKDISSEELVKELKIGWSLGNTLDATGGGGLLSTEMSWGNPATKEEMFIAVKEAGFNFIRIPVSWGDHFGPEPEYKIHAQWLDRINEVVDYAIDNDLYVILNMHHEEWHFPSYENYDKAEKILTLVWTQIADRFKNYDEKLIFEGMNEPRMKGTPQEWTGGNAEARDVINKLNQSFVDTVRKADGNNPYRHLMIPTYAASSDTKTWKDFIIPDDDKIIVSIHAYTPYNFALNINGGSEWSSENPHDTKDIDSLMDNLYEWFVSKGHPVILGEFGAMDKNNLEARVDWARYYVQKAKEKGIPCIWWDNGAFIGDGELFGLLDRRKGEWKHPEILESLMRGLE